MGHHAEVLDPGPIPYRAIALYGDADLEHGLRHAGLEPEETCYRLVRIAYADLADVALLPHMKPGRGAMIQAMKEGVAFPPIVVMPVKSGWTLLDGVNRMHAHWKLGVTTTEAYALLGASRAM
jgi:hypothetical protein